MKTLLATTALVLCTLGTANAQDAELVKARSILINPDNQPAVTDARLMFDPTPVAEWGIAETDRQQLTPQQRIAQAFEALDAPVQEIVQATRCPVLRGEPDYDWCSVQAEPVPYLTTPIFVVHVPATQQPDAPMTLVQSRAWYWAHYRATNPLTTTPAQVAAYEQQVAQQANTAAIKEAAMQAKAAASALSAHAQATPKRKSTRKH
jgi:hypothetical protein